MTTPAIPTTDRPADPRTHTRPARTMDPAELLAKVKNRIASLDALAKRGDDRDNVYAALREGRPVIPLKSVKMFGGYLPVGKEWHPGYEYIPLLIQTMDQPGYKRLLVTKEFYEAGHELSTLKKIERELEPLVTRTGSYKAQARASRAAQEEARLAEIAHKAAAEQAEENLKSADAELKNYVSGLDFDI